METLLLFLKNMVSFKVICEIPKWTDIVQCVVAVIGIPFLIISFWNLVKRDKKRESEIASLSTIASRLSLMQEENETRYRASKKPHVSISFKYDYTNSLIRLTFVNINANTTISSYEIKSNVDDLEIIRYSVNESGGKQSFLIILKFNNNPIDAAVLHLNYNTGEGYTFFQDILLWRDGYNYLHSQSAIIDSKNSQDV